MTVEQAVSVLPDGLWLSGEFVGLEPSREYTGQRDGQQHVAGPVVKVLVGRTLHSIKFRDDAALDAALPSIRDARRLDRVVVPVFAQGPWPDGAPAPQRATLRGFVPLSGQPE